MSNPNNQLLYLTAIDNDGNKQSLTLDEWAEHKDTTCINKNGQRIKITRDHIRNKYYAFRDHPERKLTMRMVVGLTDMPSVKQFKQIKPIVDAVKLKELIKGVHGRKLCG